MHGAQDFLKALTTVLAVAAVTTVVFQWVRQPVVLGYILAGLIVGPPARSRRPGQNPPSAGSSPGGGLAAVSDRAPPAPRWPARPGGTACARARSPLPPGRRGR